MSDAFGTNWMDLSSTSNRYIQTYYNGFVDISGGPLYVRNNNLNIRGGDISLNGRLYSTGDVSLGGKLFLSSDASMNGNLSIAKDMTIGGNLYVYTYTTRQTITELSYQLIVAQDLSLNGRLFLSNDASINNRLFVGSDASFNGKLFSNGLFTTTGGLSVTGTVTLPSASIADSALSTNIATLTGSQTLSNKTLTAPVISSISNSGTITIPTGTLTLATLTGTETLTNKTLTTPVISSISNSGTITIPTGTLTLASLTGTETLTNKTLTTSGLLTALSDASFNTSISVGSNISLNGQILSKNVRAIQNNIYNLALGDSTQLQNINLASSNNFNYAFGYDNLSSLTTGGTNIAVGRSNISKETTGSENFAFGTNNLNKMVGSFVNVGIGKGNMNNAYYGYYNVGVGIDNLYNCSGGNNNTAIGLSSLYALTTGAYNTAIGYGALRTSATGSGNLGLGNNAGSNLVDGQNNSFIGPDTGPASGDSNTYNNSTAIGYGAVTNASNQITIGTSSSNVKIDGNVSINGNLAISATKGISGGSITAVTSDLSVYGLNVGAGDIYVNGGVVAIGTTNTSYPLYVNTVNANNTISNAGRLTTAGATGNITSSGVSVSIRSTGTIWSEIVIFASSDKRIKTNVHDINVINALEKFRQLKPVEYYYIDKFESGSSKTYGFIAQDVKEIIPESISLEKNYIPNIYDAATVIDNSLIVLDTKTTNEFTLSGDTITVKLYDYKNQSKIVTLDKIISSTSFTIKEPLVDSDLSDNKIFVFGQ
jgi:hypothetical protein